MDAGHCEKMHAIIVFNNNWFELLLLSALHVPDPADFPSNVQFQAHFREFVEHGYKPSLGTVLIKFPGRDGTRSIPSGSVGLVDGFTKVLLMLSIICFLEELEASEAALEEMSSTLASFADIRCSYEHHENPSLFFLQSLRLLHEF